MLIRTATISYVFLSSMAFADNNPVCSNEGYMNSGNQRGCMELDISGSAKCRGNYNIVHTSANNRITRNSLRSGCSRITRERYRDHRVFSNRLNITKHKIDKIKHLTYHHQGGGSGGNGAPQNVYSGIHSWHTSHHKWGDIAYHYIVDRFGNIIEARGLEYAPNSGTKGSGSAGPRGNYHYPGHFAVVFAGNFNEGGQSPKIAALASAARILSAAQLKFGLSSNAIKPHKHHSPLGTGRQGWGTSCPGANFSRHHHRKLVNLTTAMSIQTILTNRNCRPGIVDGDIGRKTIDALVRLRSVVRNLPSHREPNKLLKALRDNSSRCSY